MNLETSARTGENVEETFLKCARAILTKIENGTLDPTKPGTGLLFLLLLLLLLLYIYINYNNITISLMPILLQYIFPGVQMGDAINKPIGKPMSNSGCC